MNLNKQDNDMYLTKVCAHRFTTWRFSDSGPSSIISFRSEKRSLSLEKRWSWMINWIKRGVIRREEAAFLGRFMQILIITANNKTPWIQVNIIFDRQNRQIQK